MWHWRVISVGVKRMVHGFATAALPKQRCQHSVLQYQVDLSVAKPRQRSLEIPFETFFKTLSEILFKTLSKTLSEALSKTLSKTLSRTLLETLLINHTDKFT